MTRLSIAAVSIFSLCLLVPPTAVAASQESDYSFEIIEKQDCGPDNKRLEKKYLVICYQPIWKIPVWVGYQLVDEHLNGSIKRTDNFRSDPEIRTQAAAPTDYKGSNYDLGQMAPPAAFRGSHDAMSTTFLMSNMAPQAPALNRGSWRAIEAFVRRLKQAGGDVWVITGNLMLDELNMPTAPEKFIGENDVAVPTHSFKAVLHRTRQREWEAYGFVAPNWFGGLPKGVSSFLVSIDEIEEMSGLDFFSVLPDEIEDRLESRVPQLSEKK